MNYATIKSYDVANGPGVRVSLFVSGCTHHCKGCFNAEAWDFQYGTPFTRETEDQILDHLKPWYIRGLSLLGGEPFEPENQPALLELMRRVHAEYPEKTVWCIFLKLQMNVLKPLKANCLLAMKLLSKLLKSMTKVVSI